MPIGRESVKAAVYFGPPLGMYAQDGFLKFLEREVVPWMNQKEIPSKFRAKVDGIKITYHFPDAGAGIEYTAYRDSNRCAVHLMCSPRGRDTLDGLFRLIMRKVREKNMGFE